MTHNPIFYRFYEPTTLWNEFSELMSKDPPPKVGDKLIKITDNQDGVKTYEFANENGIMGLYDITTDPNEWVDPDVDPLDLPRYFMKPPNNDSDSDSDGEFPPSISTKRRLGDDDDDEGDTKKARIGGKRKSTKRKSTKRKSTKRKSTKRKSTKRKSTKRKTHKRK